MNLVALVLAAGAGRRFGGNKLSANFRGEPLVHHAIRAARAAPVDRVIVVCGAELAIGDWPGEPHVQPVRIASTTLSQSLRAGIEAAGEAEGAFVFLGDMPLIPHDVAPALAAALAGNFAAVPGHAGRSGHPVLLARRAFAEVCRLDGDEGAGRSLKTRDDVAVVAVESAGIHLDVDHVEDLARLDQAPLDND